MPELRESEATAARIIIAGFFETEELSDTSASETSRLRYMMADEQPVWARLVMKMLDAKDLPAGTDVEKSTPLLRSDLIQLCRGLGISCVLGKKLWTRFAKLCAMEAKLVRSASHLGLRSSFGIT